MKRFRSFCGLAGLAIACSLASVDATAQAVAQSVKYTGLVYTDVSLGGERYHNAQVRITFVGSTGDVQDFTTPDGSVSGQQIFKGHAAVSIKSGRREVTAKFFPNQVSVSADLTNGGVGFGAYLGPGQTNYVPAYPLAFDSGTVNFNLGSLTLRGSGDYSGHAWSCITFPVTPYNGGNGHCADPSSSPLKTDKGDFVIRQPYNAFNPDGTLYDDYDGSINIGIFTVVVGATPDP